MPCLESVLTGDVIEPDPPKLRLHVSNKCGLLLLELVLISDSNEMLSIGS